MRDAPVLALLVSVLALGAAPASATTVIVRPNATTQLDHAWSVSSGVTADAALADAITHTVTPPAGGDRLIAGLGPGSATLSFPAPSLPAGATVTGATAWVYTSVGILQVLTPSVWSGSDRLAQGTWLAGTAAWRSIALQPTAAQLSALTLDLRTDGLIGFTNSTVSAAYLQVDATTPDKVAKGPAADERDHDLGRRRRGPGDRRRGCGAGRHADHRDRPDDRHGGRRRARRGREGRARRGRLPGRGDRVLPRARAHRAHGDRDARQEGARGPLRARLPRDRRRAVHRRRRQAQARPRQAQDRRLQGAAPWRTVKARVSVSSRDQRRPRHLRDARDRHPPRAQLDHGVGEPVALEPRQQRALGLHRERQLGLAGVDERAAAVPEHAVAADDGSSRPGSRRPRSAAEPSLEACQIRWSSTAGQVARPRGDL